MDILDTGQFNINTNEEFEEEKEQDIQISQDEDFVGIESFFDEEQEDKQTLSPNKPRNCDMKGLIFSPE